MICKTPEVNVYRCKLMVDVCLRIVILHSKTLHIVGKVLTFKLFYSQIRSFSLTKSLRYLRASDDLPAVI